MARKVHELPLYRSAVQLEMSVSAILERPAWRKDFNLREQLSRAVQKIPANIEEGFEQGTDRAFARYLSIAKGSAMEAAGHARRAARRGCLVVEEAESLASRAEDLARMLGGFIKYLHRSDFKDRGHHQQGS